MDVGKTDTSKHVIWVLLVQLPNHLKGFLRSPLTLVNASQVVEQVRGIRFYLQRLLPVEEREAPRPLSPADIEKTMATAPKYGLEIIPPASSSDS